MPSKSERRDPKEPLHGSSAKRKRPLVPNPTAKRHLVSKEICTQCGKPFGRESWVWGEQIFFLDCPHPREGCGGELSVEKDCPCLWAGSINPDSCLLRKGAGESEEMQPCPKCGGTGEVVEIWPCEGECHRDAWTDGKKHPKSTSQTTDPRPMLCSEVRAGYLCGARGEGIECRRFWHAECSL